MDYTRCNVNMQDVGQVSNLSPQHVRQVANLSYYTFRRCGAIIGFRKP